MVTRLQTSPPVRALVADIRDREKVDWVFRTCPPLVYHAAAYKHVPMMERHAEEAVKTNILERSTSRRRRCGRAWRRLC